MSMHGAQVVNVMHFVQEDPLPTVDAAFLANDFRTNMDATIRGRTTPFCNFQYVEVQSIVPFSGASAISNWPANTNGTSGSNSASATLCEVVTIYTSRAGRRGRGRLYLPSGDTTTTNALNGSWTSTQSARTVSFANALSARYIAHTTGLSFSLGVWSRVLAGPTPPWPSSAFVRATTLSVRTSIRTQRRRQVGVGR